MDNKYADTFREEGKELVNNLENTLLILEKEPNDIDSLHTIFRCLHTLKGSGAMFGFHSLASLAHELETAFVLLRDGITNIDKQLINLVFSSCDTFRIWLNLDPDIKMDNAMIALMDEISKWTLLHQQSQSLSVLADEKGTSQVLTYRIRFKPQENIFLIWR